MVLLCVAHEFGMTWHVNKVWHTFRLLNRMETDKHSPKHVLKSTHTDTQNDIKTRNKTIKQDLKWNLDDDDEDILHFTTIKTNVIEENANFLSVWKTKTINHMFVMQQHDEQQGKNSWVDGFSQIHNLPLAPLCNFALSQSLSVCLSQRFSFCSHCNNLNSANNLTFYGLSRCSCCWRWW